MPSQDISGSSLAALAAALRSGAIAAGELHAHACARHERLGKRMNAYIHWAPESAAACSRAADAAFRCGSDLGPLQGLPLSFKDHFGIQGMPTYAGSSRRLPKAFEREGGVVQAVKRQLAVISGKTHTVEFAAGGGGANPNWGTPFNPWDVKNARTPGGSSHGAAASLWEGSALAAFGTDTMGSVRMPAAMCGLVGFKPGFGRWPDSGIVPLSPILDSVGVLTRSVADAAFVFAAIDPAGDWAPALRAAEPGGVTIGEGDAYFWEGCQPEVEAAIRAAIKELQNKGFHIRASELPETRAVAALQGEQGGITAPSLASLLQHSLPEWIDLLTPVIRERVREGLEMPAHRYLHMVEQMRELARSAQSRFEFVDVMLTPTTPFTAPILGKAPPGGPAVPVVRNTFVVNYLGLCAISMPVALDSNGLPIGMQLIACAGGEGRLLSVALAIEQALGQGSERLGLPPLFGEPQ
ncbi:MAG: amidase [Burkholderiales bacterium]